MAPRIQRVLTSILFSPILGLISCGPPIPSEISELYDSIPQKIDFNFHVRPILSDRCYACHGPDQNQRKAGLRLDYEDNAKGELPQNPGTRAIVDGNPGKSELVKRILSSDGNLQMPPPESHLELSPKEKAILIKWIDQGAQWKDHWAFIPPAPVQIPKVEGYPIQNSIDPFILEKVLKNGLAPSPPASRERLIRRVTMDLTGLPPTLEEIDKFLTDQDDDAYDKLVDRLLDTEAYGERMAMEWMDLARYADSHGMHADGWRLMWPWRDWVIESFNQNMPYDQFVTWQLAGDLLPNATREQKLATAFHRNHPMTAEGGVVDEEFRLEYVADRTNTTATAFLGLTMECARCHDHKFDPISQKDYYQLSAFFNNVKELGMTGDDGNYGPMLMLPDPGVEEQLKEIDQKLIEMDNKLRVTQEEALKLRRFLEESTESLSIRIPEDGYYPLDQISKVKNDEGQVEKILDGNRNAIVRSDPDLVPGKFGMAVHFDSEYEQLDLKGIGNIEMNDPFTAGAWVFCDNPGTNQTIMGNAGSKNVFWRGWEFHLDSLNRPGVRLINSLPHNYIDVRSTEAVADRQWTQIYFTYDGTAKASGVKIFINGQRVKTQTIFDQLYRSIKPVQYKAGDGKSHQLQARPVKVGRSGRAFTGDNGVFQGSIDQIKVYESYLTDLEIGVNYQQEVGNKESMEGIEDMAHLDHYLHRQSGPYQQTSASYRLLLQEKLNLSQDVLEVMVMEDMRESRNTYLLERGQYDSPREIVIPGTPASVLEFPDSLPNNRLGLAQWLFHGDNPLTARVAVNRYWQLFFRQGLVNTPHDFGSQGALPSHPELLDWLAIQFMESGWDLKALVRLIVTSSTYRQSSFTEPAIREIDPQNYLLARGPNYRLPAEMIRDNALAASGLLNPKTGGPSAKPYQSDSLWIELGNFSQMLLYYQPDQGDDLYRRTLYTFIRRTSPHPYLTTFDVTDRSVCTVKREITNTPLQSLILLNEPQFVEAARVLAERIQKEGGESVQEQIEHGFRLAIGRSPDDREAKVLYRVYQEEVSRFGQSPQDARKLLTVGDHPPDITLKPTQTAALAIVCSTILNLDEAYMKR